MSGQVVSTGRPARLPLARIAMAELRHHPRRYVAVVVAIMFSVAYLVASVTVVAGESATIEQGVVERTKKADVVITDDASDPGTQAALVERVRGVAGVATAGLIHLSIGRVTGSSEFVQQQSVPDDPRLWWTELVQGRWASTPGEVVLGTVTAKQLNLGIGDQITINDGNSSATLAVTGLSHEGTSLLSGLAQTSLVHPSFYSAADSIHTSAQTEILVVGTGEVSAVRLADRVRAVARGSRVETSSAFGRRELSESTGGVFVFELLLVMFGGIALLVGGIMIVNTFLILLAQRRRQIGLLRAIGAGRSQLRLSLLVEASAIGVVGALPGVGLGLAAAAAIAAAIDGQFTVPVGQVLTLAAVGVAIAVLAALLPARRANRITPLEALRPVDDETTARRATVVRRAGSLALCAIGGAGIWYSFGDGTYALAAALGGAFVAAVGLLSATGLFLPWVLRGLSRLVAGAGPTARLAGNNALRNPGRAAATGAALMLAVGLVVTLQVGAASVKATVDSGLHTRFPVDVTVSMFDGPLPDRAVTDVAGVAGITSAEGVRSARVRFDPGNDPTQVRVLAPDAATLGQLSEPRPPTASDVVLVDPYLLRDHRLRDGRTVTLTGPGGAVRLAVRGDYLAPAGSLIVAPAVLHRLAPDAPVGSVWAQAGPDADITALRSALRTVAAPITGAEVGGGLSGRATYGEILDRLLLLSTMLLAVAVLIALVGVGNTLGLSVLERTRESALLRALGLQRGQLRGMLAVEAVLLSVAGTVVGTAAGMFFGWVGTHAISNELHFPTVRFAMSPTQTVAVAAVAVAAGMAASVLPGRRAARAVPVDALADT